MASLERPLEGHRAEVERVELQAARSMPFVALRCGRGGALASAGDAIDLAWLMVAWTELNRDAGLVCNFETRDEASSWLTAAPPPLPVWAARTCVATNDEYMIGFEDETDPSPFIALLGKAGGQLAEEANAALILRLVSTIKALNGEVVLVRMLPSVSDAEEWLLTPHVPLWMMAPPAVLSAPGATEADDADDAVVVTVTTADGAVELSDDYEVSDGNAEASEICAFRRAAQALPPPPPLKRTILSLATMKDAMLLPVAFQRHPRTERFARYSRKGPSRGQPSLSSAGRASLLTSHSPSPSPSRTIQTAGKRKSRTPWPQAPTCTPVPARASTSDRRRTKELRTGDAVPIHLGLLAKSILRRKKGLFVTGGGAVGKTRDLRQCTEEHRQGHGGSRVGWHAIAPTGVAAAAAGGVTVYSYLRLPAGCFDESVSEEQDATRLYDAMDGITKRRLTDTTLVLLDEVSMVCSRMFTTLTYL